MLAIPRCPTCGDTLDVPFDAIPADLEEAPLRLAVDCPSCPEQYVVVVDPAAATPVERVRSVERRA